MRMTQIRIENTIQRAVEQGGGLRVTFGANKHLPDVARTMIDNNWFEVVEGDMAKLADAAEGLLVEPLVIDFKPTEVFDDARLLANMMTGMVQNVEFVPI